MFHPLASGLIYTLSGRRVTDASPTNLGECMAIEQCKIYDSKGNLKKVVSAEECSDQFWDQGFELALGVKREAHRKQIVKNKTRNWVCVQCNKTFTATIERKYCCTPCTDPNDYTTKVHKLTIMKCAMCKQVFQPNTPRHIFCNKPCISQTKKRADAALKTVACKLCGKLFKTTRKFKYCNNPCDRWTAYHLKQKKLKENDNASNEY